MKLEINAYQPGTANGLLGLPAGIPEGGSRGTYFRQLEVFCSYKMLITKST